MNAFLSVVKSHKITDTTNIFKRTSLKILQVNMGNLCNQSCWHCHIDASPNGKKVMAKQVVDNIIGFLFLNRGLVLDITGGAPELNPHFDYFLLNARLLVKEIIVRSNLTVFFEPGKSYLFNFFKENKIHLICSLPCYSKVNVDKQRGEGVFKKSIDALLWLNKIGYARREDLRLDIVYNPNGAYLPPQQKELENRYRDILRNNYGIEFNKLITITNAPIKRFRDYLETNGEYGKYLDILRDSFNPEVLENIMCRYFLSVGFDGRVYDCDFNQALEWAIKDTNGVSLTIEKVDSNKLKQREIMVGEHCLTCTAGYGSSCQGALSEKQPAPIKDDKIDSKTTESVKLYYGRILKSKNDLKTSACCPSDSMPADKREILKKINPEILDKFYGCGSPIPEELSGCAVLDLGCGTGRDVYLASYLVGERGFVIGVDMTSEQLDVARRHLGSQMKEFGFSKPNVKFVQGYIENLEEIGIRDNSIDVAISNCVINLSSDKKAVFSQIFRILKPGGELYFSDVFSGRRLPDYLREDEVLYGECLGGALYIEDFRRLLQEIGVFDYRVVQKRRIALDNPKIKDKVGNIDFYSMTIRAFKIDDLEDACEDYGQAAIYLGTIPQAAHQFILDEHHIFMKDKPALICGNTASMLERSRYGRHFKIIGDRQVHFGPFDCKSAQISSGSDSVGGGCC